MKKFFGANSTRSSDRFRSSSSSQKQGKYQPEKGVPECVGKTIPVVHRGNISWELAEFGSLLQAETKKPYPSLTSGRLVLPTEHRLAFTFTVFPKGASAKSVDHVGLRFQVLSVPKEETGALINYRLLMLNGKSKILATVEGSKEFKEKDAVEFEKLILIESLLSDEQLLLGKDSKVIFVCEITARTSFQESTFTSVQLDFKAACQEGEHKLAEDLGRLLDSGDNSCTADIRLMVPNGAIKNEEWDVTEFSVHSLILEVRAPGLMAALKTKKEFVVERRATLEVQKEVLKELIRFLYTGTVSSKSALKNFDLLSLALKFKIHELVSLCEQAQAESLEVNSVANVLRQVEKLNIGKGAEVLKSSCLDFIHYNYGTVSKTKGWKQFSAEYPNLALVDQVLSFSNANAAPK